MYVFIIYVFRKLNFMLQVKEKDLKTENTMLFQELELLNYKWTSFHVMDMWTIRSQMSYCHAVSNWLIIIFKNVLFSMKKIQMVMINQPYATMWFCVWTTKWQWWKLVCITIFLSSLRGTPASFWTWYYLSIHFRLLAHFLIFLDKSLNVWVPH